MTADEIAAEPAGNRLDALVARHVFGLPIYRDSMHQLWKLGTERKTDQGRPPPYSTRIEDAWEVVQKFAPYIKVDARGDGQGQWSCSVWVGGPEVIGYGATAMLAVCRAALRAVAR